MGNKKGKKLFTGVFLLTLSGIAVKICGLLFKIPLVSIIGEEGMGYFGSAYVIYTFFYVLSSSGLPVGLSIIVANETVEEKRRTYLTSALISFGFVGFALCLLMLLFPDIFAGFIGNKGASLSISVLGPTLLFVCLSGGIRGYFQGLSDMQPTAVSQTLEALFKIFFGLILAYWTVRIGGEIKKASAMALTGILIGSAVSFLYLFVKLMGHIRKTGAGLRLPVKAHYKHLFSVVLPVSASSVVMSIASVLDLTMIMRRLQDVGYTAKEANYLFGSYTGLAVPVFNLPPVLIAPIVSAVLPLFVSSLCKEEKEQTFELSQTSFRLSMIVGAPCAVGMAVLSRPIMTMLFGKESASVAAILLAILAPSVLFVALSTVSGALLQGLGKRKIPVYSVLLGSFFKMVVGYFLIGRYGIIGAPIGTFVCYFISAAVNLFFCYRYGLLRKCGSKTFLFPTLGGVLCGIAARAVYQCLLFMGNTPAVLFGVLSGATVYLLFLLISGTVSKQMTEYVPIGKKKIKTEKFNR